MQQLKKTTYQIYQANDYRSEWSTNPLDVHIEHAKICGATGCRGEDPDPVICAKVQQVANTTDAKISINISPGGNRERASGPADLSTFGLELDYFKKSFEKLVTLLPKIDIILVDYEQFRIQGLTDLEKYAVYYRCGMIESLIKEFYPTVEQQWHKTNQYSLNDGDVWGMNTHGGEATSSRYSFNMYSLERAYECYETARLTLKMGNQLMRPLVPWVSIFGGYSKYMETANKLVNKWIWYTQLPEASIFECSRYVYNNGYRQYINNNLFPYVVLYPALSDTRYSEVFRRQALDLWVRGSYA